MPKQVETVPVPRLPRTRQKTKSCPFCAETIRYEAIKCRFCGEFLSRQRRKAQAESAPPEPEDELTEPAPEEEEEDGNMLLWCGRPSLFALFGCVFKTVLFVAACWAVLHYPVTALVTLIPKANVPPVHLALAERWLDLLALGLGSAAMLALAWRTLALKSIYYEVTPDRIEWSRGVFDRHVDNIDMFRVIDLKLRRSLIECLLGIGTVVLTTKDDSDPHFEFVKVHRCRHLYDIVKEAGLKADKKRGVIHLE